MEALSGVASGMAVVSLTVQLMQSTNTIKTFIRDVKGASKELERLSELLDCLSALLTDVHDVMERQTSLKHCPLPPQTIFDCLKGCKGSLGLLEDIARKYERKQSGSASAMRKLKDDIRFGFKTQDITGIEARIQRDINGLDTALGTNATNIQLTTLSILLRHEQSRLTSISAPQINHQWGAAPSRTPVNSVDQEKTSLVKAQYGISTRSRQQWILSSLRNFGIYVQKSKRETSIAGQETNGTETASKVVTFASYDAILPLLGYGIHMSRAYCYGNISPALRVFPVVKSLDTCFELFQSGTLQMVQQAFRSGVIHPFTKSEGGHTLLHLAAATARPDICHLLREYGVKAEFSVNQQSPLMYSLHSVFRGSDNHVQIDTFRTLLLEFDTIDDLSISLRPLKFIHPWEHFAIMTIEVTEWIWINAALALDNTNLVILRASLLHMLIDWYNYGFSRYSSNEIHQVLTKLIDGEMAAEYLRGTYVLLPAIFWKGTHLGSKWRGDFYLSLLASLQLDVEACVAKEFEHLPGGIMEADSTYDPNRRIIFKKDEEQRPTLRWEWVYDPHALGYHVVSEFSALVSDFPFVWDPLKWPFGGFMDGGYTYEHLQHRKLNEAQRFNRRTAAKARKERARTGQKRSRSKMPGAWDW